MNAIARYLLVFLLGWSGAVWSYSDLIYKTNKTSGKIEKPQKANDISFVFSSGQMSDDISSETNFEPSISGGIIS